MFRRLAYTNHQLYEVELVKSEIEHKETVIVGFFNLQNAKLRMLELYYNSFDKYCDVTKFEELEMDTESLFLVLSEHALYDCVRPAMKKSGTLCEVETVGLNFQPSQELISSLVLAALSIRITIGENLAYSRKNSASQN